MKLILAFLAGALLATAAFAEPAALPATLRTLDGHEFKGVALRSVTPDAVQIVHDDGTASIAFANLPEDLRAKLGYDPTKAAEFTKRAAAARSAAAAAQTKAEIAQQLAKDHAANSREFEFVVDQVLSGGAIVRPMVHVPIGGGTQATHVFRSVPGEKSAFVKGIRNVTEDQRCTVLAYRDGIWAEEGRSLEQWIFVQHLPAK